MTGYQNNRVIIISLLSSELLCYYEDIWFELLQMGRLSPLHFACGLHGVEGIHITRMLLDSLADPDARAKEDDSYLSHFLVSQ